MNWSDPAFLEAANAAAEKVTEVGQFASIGDTDFVVCMNVDGEQFIWYIDLLGPDSIGPELVAALVTQDGVTRDVTARAWRTITDTDTRDWVRRKAQGAADKHLNIAEKAARALLDKGWKKNPAATRVVNDMEALGVTIKFSSLRHRLKN